MTNVARWRHQTETFSALLALCAWNPPVTVEFPSQRPVARSFNVFLICALTNGWVNNREAGDLRHHRARYDVMVMIYMTKQTVKLLLYSKQSISTQQYVCDLRDICLQTDVGLKWIYSIFIVILTIRCKYNLHKIDWYVSSKSIRLTHLEMHTCIPGDRHFIDRLISMWAPNHSLSITYWHVFLKTNWK